MMQRDDLVSFGDMIDAARRTQQIASDKDESAFEADEVVPLALTCLVQVIGEAARQVSVPGRAALPQIPWPDVVGMRNRIVHEYRNLDLDVLWDTVIDDLSPSSRRWKWSSRPNRRILQ